MKMKEELLYPNGTKVYMCKYDKVIEGVVTSVEIVRLDHWGTHYDAITGDRYEYCAKFGNYDYERQTYEWKFFSDRKKASKKLAYEASWEIIELENKKKKWTAIKEAAEELSK